MVVRAARTKPAISSGLSSFIRSSMRNAPSCSGSTSPARIMAIASCASSMVSERESDLPRPRIWMKRAKGCKGRIIKVSVIRQASAGRGRKGRSFSAIPVSNIAMETPLRPSRISGSEGQ